jgi:two-component system sensor histidine kinase UhpB
MAFAATAAQEEKQTEIGQELHDNINQILAASKMYLGPLLKGNIKTRKNAEIVKSYIQMAIDEIRTLSHKLVAPVFKEKTLKEVFSIFPAKLENGGRIKLQINKLNENIITPEIKLAIYRITQEQINNISKYANAQNVFISIGEDERQINLVIIDDGIGFDTKQTRKGIGINNIYSRAEALNGHAEIISAPGKGCELLVSIPVNE